jgi:hypothetical protein
MKKYSWIVALLIALSLAFFGCYVDDQEDEDGGDDGDDLPVYNETVELKKKGGGWEAILELLPAPSKGDKLTNGDVYELDYEFSVELHNAFDFDASTQLDIEFLDTTEQANGWKVGFSTPIEIKEDATNKWATTMKGKADLVLTADSFVYKADGVTTWWSPAHEDGGGYNNKVIFRIDDSSARGNSKVVLNFEKLTLTKK